MRIFQKNTNFGYEVKTNQAKLKSIGEKINKILLQKKVAQIVSEKKRTFNDIIKIVHYYFINVL